MNSRERVYATLEFRTPDRVPRDLWTLPWVGMGAAAQCDALVKEFTFDIFGAGCLGKGDRASGGAGRKGTYVDEWGCVWEAAEDGVVGEVKGFPIADLSALATYQPPWEVIQRADFDNINRAQDANLKLDNPKFLMGGSSVRPFERLQFLRGNENLYMDIGYGSAEFRKLVAMVHEFYVKELTGIAKTNCDGSGVGDDWGSQRNLLISPDMWREYFKPLYKDYGDILHGAGKKFFFHSDGNISSIYPDLIEIGVDAVNSQLFCMDIEELGRLYKGKITFWGEIDRQHVLPFGTVQDVYRAVGRVRRALDDGRGGVIAHCEWGKNNPAENIRAVYEAWDKPINELPT